MLRRVVCAAVGLVVGVALLAEAVHLGARPNTLLVLPAAAVGGLAAAGLSWVWRKLDAAGRDIDRWSAEIDAAALENQAIRRANDVLTVDAATRWRGDL
ncbi:hypothetical protein GCM10010399_43880 [Dactylosporangium fulvum]|uniref:Uncharacterized protein n=1 Tax=Dactylosporangium fulvum TaxID=53359 RepID=A0ABY5W7D8_9ACTN|nr:hypothetical protein [Dactylosporangium fulvum]UWP85945.1 hypothetical protein Dfulv_17500 [Dactylosporangium fulvum]